jgi:hypothetical protein
MTPDVEQAAAVDVADAPPSWAAADCVRAMFPALRV